MSDFGALKRVHSKAQGRAHLEFIVGALNDEKFKKYKTSAFYNFDDESKLQLLRISESCEIVINRLIKFAYEQFCNFTERVIPLSVNAYQYSKPILSAISNFPLESRILITHDLIKYCLDKEKLTTYKEIPTAQIEFVMDKLFKGNFIKKCQQSILESLFIDKKDFNKYYIMDERFVDSVRNLLLLGQRIESATK